MPLNIDLQQICLHLFNFGLLFGGLYFLLYNPVKKFMASREKTYQDKADEAEANLKVSEETKALYEAKLAGADAEIQELKNQARVEMSTAADKRIASANEEAEKIVAKAKTDAQREKERIVSSAQSDISAMVKEATEKLALKASASEEFDAFLDAAEGRSDAQ